MLEGRYNINMGDDFYAYIRQPSTNLYFTNDNNNNVCVSDGKFDDTQLWHFKRLGTGAYNIINVATGRYMDVYGNYITDGTNIQTHDGISNVAKQFFIYFIDGNFYFKTANTNRVLDVDSATRNVQIFGGDRGVNDATMFNARSFEILKLNIDGFSIKTDFGKEFTGYIRNVASGLLMTADGDNVIFTDAGYGANQKWIITRNDYGGYEIKSALNGKVFDVYGGYMEKGTQIDLYEPNGTKAQRFFFIDAGQSRVYIKPVYSELVVDMNAAERQPYTWTYSTSEENVYSQVFELVMDIHMGEDGVNRQPEYLGDEVKASITVQNTGYAATDKSTMVAMTPYTGNADQVWTLKYDKEWNAYTVIGCSGKVFDVYARGYQNGDDITLWEENGLPHQKFRFYKVDGGYIISPANSQRVFDVETADNTTLQLWGSGPLPNKIFNLASVTTGEDTLILKDNSIYSKVETYVTKVKTETSAKSALEQFKNTNTVVYNANGEKISENAVCGTGFKVNLIVNGNIVDSLTMVISGDVDGNGVVDSTDYMRIKSMFLGTYNLVGEYFVAGDVDASGTIDTTDYLRLKSAFMGTYNLD
jgi:hypothetical protein